MSPFRLLDLPHIDRVFSLTGQWQDLFTLSLCSSKCQKAIKKWARKSNLCKIWTVRFLAGESALLIIDTAFDEIGAPLLLMLSTRDVLLGDMDHYGGFFELKDHFRMQSVVNHERPCLTGILEPFEKRVAKIVEHLIDLFDFSLLGIHFEPSLIKDLDVYLKSNWVKECKDLDFCEGSLPELPWILDNFRFQNLKLKNVNPGSDFHHVIKTNELTIIEHFNSYFPEEKVLMLLDCKKIELYLFNVRNENVNMFIKKWLEPPYNQKFQELTVSTRQQDEEKTFGNPDRILDGIENQDVTPPNNDPDYNFYKEVVRGDGQKAVLFTYGALWRPDDSPFVSFEVGGDADSSDED